MRIPRDMDAATLCKSLVRMGYVVTRQTGSHIRLTIEQPDQHHLTVPNHSPIKIGTLNAILTDVAKHLALPRDEILKRLLSGK
jgi:predicted RNA binding protein YcfA (HicA-like mRNA interferase family)